MEATVDLAIQQNTTALFTALYEKAFPRVAAFVSHRKGSLQDAKDIFQDALVIFYEKMMAHDLRISVSREAYILGIAKHLWIRKFNHDKLNVSLDDVEREIVIPEDYFPTVEQNKLLSFLELTGKRCLELLKAFYYDKLSAQDVSEKFGYGSTHSTTVQKFKCLEKVRDRVKGKSISYEDFTE
jgi:DNA-directed RNA polymerase specialized sigma24 family protein